MSAATERRSIAVLLSPALHPVSARPCAGAADLAALALGLRLAGAEGPDAFYAGAAADTALTDYLACGCRRLHLLRLPAEQDVVEALAGAVRGYDLVLCGTRSGGGMASGLLPYLLAEALGRPLLPGLSALERSVAGVSGTQALPQGELRRVEAAWPVLASVAPRASAPLPWRFAGLSEGRILSRPASGRGLPAVAVEPERRAVPLAAARADGGHERMLQAIAAGDAKKAGRVVNQGDSVEKAQVVLDYLRHHRLVDY